MPVLGVQNGGPDAASPDWSTIPQLVLWCIVQHIDDSSDIASLRLTCRRWSKSATQNSQEWRVRGPVAKFYWSYLRGTLYTMCPVVERLTLSLSNRISGDALGAMFTDLNWWSRLRELVLVAIRPTGWALFGPGLPADALSGLSALRGLQALTLEGCEAQTALRGALSCAKLTKLVVRSRRSPLAATCHVTNRFLELLIESQQAISLGQPRPQQRRRRRVRQHRDQGQDGRGNGARGGAAAAGGGGGLEAGGGGPAGSSSSSASEAGKSDSDVSMADYVQLGSQGLDLRELQELFREDGKEEEEEDGGGGGGREGEAAAAAAVNGNGDLKMEVVDKVSESADRAEKLREEKEAERRRRPGASCCGGGGGGGGSGDGGSGGGGGGRGSSGGGAVPPYSGLRHLEFDADAHLNDATSMMALLEGQTSSNTLFSDRLAALLAALPNLEHLDIRRVAVQEQIIANQLAGLTRLTELRIGIQDNNAPVVTDGRLRMERGAGANRGGALTPEPILRSLAALSQMGGPWVPPPAPLPTKQQHRQQPQLRRWNQDQLLSTASASNAAAKDLDEPSYGPPPGPGRPALHLYVTGGGGGAAAASSSSSSPEELLAAMLPLVPRLQTLFLSHRALSPAHLLSVGHLTSLKCLALSLATWPSGASAKGNGASASTAAAAQRRIQLASAAAPPPPPASVTTVSIHPPQLRHRKRGAGGGSFNAMLTRATAAADPDSDMHDADEVEAQVSDADGGSAADGGAPIGAGYGIGLDALLRLTRLRELHLKGPQRPVGLATRVAAGLQALATNEPPLPNPPPPPQQQQGTRPLSGSAGKRPIGGADSPPASASAWQRRHPRGARQSDPPPLPQQQQQQRHGSRPEEEWQEDEQPRCFRLHLPSLHQRQRPQHATVRDVRSVPSQDAVTGPAAEMAPALPVAPRSPGGPVLPQGPRVAGNGAVAAPSLPAAVAAAVGAALGETSGHVSDAMDTGAASVASVSTVDDAVPSAPLQLPGAFVGNLPLAFPSSPIAAAAGSAGGGGGAAAVVAEGAEGARTLTHGLRVPSGLHAFPQSPAAAAVRQPASPEMQALAAALALAAAEWEGPSGSGAGGGGAEGLGRGALVDGHEAGQWPMGLPLPPGVGDPLAILMGDDEDMDGEQFLFAGALGAGRAGARGGGRFGRGGRFGGGGRFGVDGGGGGGGGMDGGIMGGIMPMALLRQFAQDPLLRQHQRLLLQHQALLQLEHHQALLQREHQHQQLEDLQHQPQQQQPQLHRQQEQQSSPLQLPPPGASQQGPGGGSSSGNVGSSCGGGGGNDTAPSRARGGAKGGGPADASHRSTSASGGGGGGGSSAARSRGRGRSRGRDRGRGRSWLSSWHNMFGALLGFDGGGGSGDGDGDGDGGRGLSGLSDGPRFMELEEEAATPSVLGDLIMEGGAGAEAEGSGAAGAGQVQGAAGAWGNGMNPTDAANRNRDPDLDLDPDPSKDRRRGLSRQILCGGKVAGDTCSTARDTDRRAGSSSAGSGGSGSAAAAALSCPPNSSGGNAAANGYGNGNAQLPPLQPPPAQPSAAALVAAAAAAAAAAPLPPPQPLHVSILNGDQMPYAAHALQDLARDQQLLRRAVLPLQRCDVAALATHGAVLEALTLHYFRMPPSVVSQLTTALPRLRRLSLRWANDEEALPGSGICSCGHCGGGGGRGASAGAAAATISAAAAGGRGSLEISKLPPLLDSLEIGGPVMLSVTAAALDGPCGSRQSSGPLWTQLRRLVLSGGIGLPGGVLPALLERTPHLTELQLLLPRALEPPDLASLEPLDRLRCLVMEADPADMACLEARRALSRGISRLSGLTALQELRWSVPDPPSQRRRLSGAAGDLDKLDHNLELCQQLSSLTGLQRLSLLSLPSCRHLLTRLEELQALRHLPFLELSS